MMGKAGKRSKLTTQEWMEMVAKYMARRTISVKDLTREYGISTTRFYEMLPAVLAFMGRMMEHHRERAEVTGSTSLRLETYEDWLSASPNDITKEVDRYVQKERS